MAKLKIAVSAVVVAGLGTALVIEQLSVTSLRRQNRALEAKAVPLRQTAAPGATHPKLPAGNLSLPQAEGGLGQATAFGLDTNRLAALRAENHQLHQATGEPEDPAEAEFKAQKEERMRQVKQGGLAFQMYANDHTNRFPAAFEAVADYLPQGNLEFLTNNLDILYQGDVVTGNSATNTLLFRDRQTLRSPGSPWVRIYGFADGSAEAHTEPDAAHFDAWEAAHIAAAAPGANASPTHP